jgi:hypothetical protein
MSFRNLPLEKLSGVVLFTNLSDLLFGEFGATVGLASGLKSRRRAMSNRV